MLPHVARRDMAGIDRRVAGSDQREDRRLRSFQHGSDFGGAVRGDFRYIVPPRFARIEAQSLGGPPAQQIPGAFDVGRGERPAVMPFDPLAQFEGQPEPVLAPRPALGQVRNDRIEAVLRHVLVVKHEVVEHRHHRDRDRVGAFLVDRHARRAVAVIDPQDPAGLLRLHATARQHDQQQPCRRETPQAMSAHFLQSSRAHSSGRVFHNI